MGLPVLVYAQPKYLVALENTTVTGEGSYTVTTTQPLTTGDKVPTNEVVTIDITPETGYMVDVVSVVETKGVVSSDPKAFVGNQATVDALDDEAKTAGQWFLDNVPNSTYVYDQDIIDGNVHLSDFQLVWCHFNWVNDHDWDNCKWDAMSPIKDYYKAGGAMLVSRDAVHNIGGDRWDISINGRDANNYFGYDPATVLTFDLGFKPVDISHPLFKGLTPDVDNRILCVASGCKNTNRTAQWGVDWPPYGSMQGWADSLGAVSLAQDHGGDVNRCTIAEFVPREGSGRVITIGTPAFEWYDPSNAVNPYAVNRTTLAQNAINYLLGYDADASAQVVTPTQVTETKYTFDMPAYSVTVKVTFKSASAPTNVETIESSTSSSSRKVFRDGQVFIQRDGKYYTISGQEVK